MRAAPLPPPADRTPAGRRPGDRLRSQLPKHPALRSVPPTPPRPTRPAARTTRARLHARPARPKGPALPSQPAGAAPAVRWRPAR